MSLPTLRLATAHLSPSLSCPSTTLTNILTAISHASTHNATLITFPESTLPFFPVHSALLAPSHPSTHDFFTHFAATSIYADGPEIHAIRQAAKRGKISVSLGFSEKARWSPGTLWNSNIIIDEGGGVAVLHRKVVPTFFEKLSWGNGDGMGLRTVEVGVRGLDGDGDGEGGGKGKEKEKEDGMEDGREAGKGEDGAKVKIGTLICGENTNPLARFAMMSQGQHVHVSTWPAIWPTRMPMEPTSSSSGRDDTTTTPRATTTAKENKTKGKNFDNILANRIRAGGYCFEAKCFGVMCAAYWSAENTRDLVAVLPENESELRKTVEYALKNSSQAASMFLDPTGTPVMGFVIDEQGNKAEKEMLQHEEGVLFADVDLNECIEGKQFHDLVGGYQRLDIFELKVDRRRRELVKFVDL